MNFAFSITVPAHTPKDNPHIEELILDRGLVQKIRISSSPAVNGEVYCRIETIWGRKLLPRNTDGYRLLGYPIEAEYPAILYASTGDKMKLRFVGWSPNANYSHAIHVGVWIIPKSYKEIEEILARIGG